jgi:hypothetical protein
VSASASRRWSDRLEAPPQRLSSDRRVDRARGGSHQIPLLHVPHHRQRWSPESLPCRSAQQEPKPRSCQDLLERGDSAVGPRIATKPSERAQSPPLVAPCSTTWRRPGVCRGVRTDRHPRSRAPSPRRFDHGAGLARRRPQRSNQRTILGRGNRRPCRFPRRRARLERSRRHHTVRAYADHPATAI